MNKAERTEKKRRRLKVLANQSTSFATFEYTFRPAIHREADALIGNAGNNIFIPRMCVCVLHNTPAESRSRTRYTNIQHGATAKQTMGIRQGTIDDCV